MIVATSSLSCYVCFVDTFVERYHQVIVLHSPWLLKSHSWSNLRLMLFMWNKEEYEMQTVQLGFRHTVCHGEHSNKETEVTFGRCHQVNQPFWKKCIQVANRQHENTVSHFLSRGGFPIFFENVKCILTIIITLLTMYGIYPACATASLCALEHSWPLKWSFALEWNFTFVHTRTRAGPNVNDLFWNAEIALLDFRAYRPDSDWLLTSHSYENGCMLKLWRIRLC